MKNPLDKNDDSTLITILAITTVTAATLTYLYLTQGGANARKAITHKLKDEAKNLASGFVSGKTGISKITLKKVADHFVK